MLPRVRGRSNRRVVGTQCYTRSRAKQVILNDQLNVELFLEVLLIGDSLYMILDVVVLRNRKAFKHDSLQNIIDSAIQKQTDV